MMLFKVVSGSGKFLLGLSPVLVPAILAASDRSDWQERMQPIIPRTYLCRRAVSPIVIDGNLDDPAWSHARWTDDFVDIEGRAKPKPRLRTRAKLLWDDDYLYIAAELREPHVWATLTNHDALIFRDPDFEVFIDPQGKTQPYYEFEMNALNTTWDLLFDKPYMDSGKPHNEWEIPGLKSAVHINGTLNDPDDKDRGWTVELAFPWKVLSEHARHGGPPGEGEQSRIDFSRVEWQVDVTNRVYHKIPGKPQDNWVWSPSGVVDMHRPEMWSLVQFTTRPATESISVAPIAGRTSRDLVLGVYYAERDFWKEHRRWATNLTELGETGWSLGKLSSRACFLWKGCPSQNGSSGRKTMISCIHGSTGSSALPTRPAPTRSMRLTWKGRPSQSKRPIRAS
jgi:hypothetical protein